MVGCNSPGTATQAADMPLSLCDWKGRRWGWRQWLAGRSRQSPAGHQQSATSLSRPRWSLSCEIRKERPAVYKDKAGWHCPPLVPSDNLLMGQNEHISSFRKVVTQTRENFGLLMKENWLQGFLGSDTKSTTVGPFRIIWAHYDCWFCNAFNWKKSILAENEDTFKPIKVDIAFQLQMRKMQHKHHYLNS